MIKVLVMLSYYNGETFIDEQINSILSQKGVNIHLIIRDDGSENEGKNKLELFKHNNNIETFYGKNIGCTNSFFWLLKYAYDHCLEYDYFAFSDQDDYWLEEKLIRATTILEKRPREEMNLYCSNLIVTDKNLKKLGMMWPKNVKINLENSIVENHCAGCTMVFNKEVVRFFSNNRPCVVKLHDKWLFHTCLIFGNIYYDENSYILYRQHGNNVEGAGLGWKAKMSNAFKSLCNISKQHTKEEEAQELINIYKGSLSVDQFEIINMVASYKKSIRNRFKLLYGYRGIRMNNTFDNLKMKIRIILGSL